MYGCFVSFTTTGLFPSNCQVYSLYFVHASIARTAAISDLARRAAVPRDAGDAAERVARGAPDPGRHTS